MIPPENCTGCSACFNKCTKNAISMAENGEGFRFPKIDAYLCSNCKECEKVCPVLNCGKNIENEALAFAAFNKNSEVVKASSSGGIFYSLAEFILANGGIVFGAAFDDNLNLEIVAVENIKELYKLQGSKYIQANIQYSFKQAKNELENGRMVLFSGTPCQIAGLYAFLGSKEKYSNLFTADLICHGVPSTRLFRKYITEIEKREKSKIKKIYFRDKKYGWKWYSIANLMEGELGGKLCQRKYSCFHKKDLFMNLFLADVALRECCYDCDFQKKGMQADISLGDFWNISDVFPKMDKNQGVSLVLLNSEQGIYIWDNVKENFIFKQTTVKHRVYKRNNERRSEFFAELDALPLKDLQKKYGIKIPKFPLFLRRVLSRIKTFLKSIKLGG